MTDIVAMTIGSFETPLTVCVEHVDPTETVLGRFTTDDLEPTETCNVCDRTFHDMIHVSVANPDDYTDMPIYDGPADMAHTRLIDGTYDAWGGNADHYTLTVSDNKTTVTPVGDEHDRI